MPRHNFFEGGSWNAQCDICSRTWKAGELKLTWDNYRACQQCWYPRNPQDFIRGIPEHQNTPWNRPTTDAYTRQLALVTPNPVNPIPGALSSVAYTPNAPANTFTTDATFIFALGLPVWRGGVAYPNNVILNKGTTAGSLLAYSLTLSNTGFLGFFFFTPAFAFRIYSATVPLPFADNTVGYVRVKWQSNNGGGSSQLTYETSTDGVTYTPLGATLFQAISTMYVSSANVELGPVAGSLLSFKAFTNASLPSPVFSMVANDAGILIPPPMPPVPYSWVSSLTGETWTLQNMAEVIPQTVPT